jgi:hypothetical protein
MILKYQTKRPDEIGWVFVDGIKNFGYDILNKDTHVDGDENGGQISYVIPDHEGRSVDAIIELYKNYMDYLSIFVKVWKPGMDKPEEKWFITDAGAYLLNDEGQTIEKIR